jgi:adenylyltransferase/sulfurtransferase
LDGVARVFDPATGPCYECTMSDVDWKMLEARRSCALLSRAEMEGGKVPTTPTTASVIAGIETQEAVKLLHGRETLEGQGFIFDGALHNSYVVKYKRKPDCPSHDAYDPWEVLPWSAATTRIGDFLEKVRGDLGKDAVIELNQDVLASLHCEKCGEEEAVWASLGKVTEKQGRCPKCGENRSPRTFHTIGEEDSAGLLDRTLAGIGVPAWDVLGGRAGLNQRFYEFQGDRAGVLGALAGESK